MEVIYLIFHACLRLRFLDVETNPGPRRPVPAVCRIFCSKVRGLARNLSDLTVASSQNDILFCSETLVKDMRHASELLVPVSVTLSCCVGARCLGPVQWRHTYEMVTEHFANPNLRVVVATPYSIGSNRAKMLLKGHLGIKWHSQYNKVIRLLQYSSANS